jgi:hypothetical protein
MTDTFRPLPLSDEAVCSPTPEIYLAEIARLRAAFKAYAKHDVYCSGGDGGRCACGFLDEWTRLNG